MPVVTVQAAQSCKDRKNELKAVIFTTTRESHAVLHLQVVTRGNHGSYQRGQSQIMSSKHANTGQTVTILPTVTTQPRRDEPCNIKSGSVVPLVYTRPVYRGFSSQYKTLGGSHLTYS